MLLRSSGVFAFATLAIITLLCKQTVGATLHVPSDIPTIQGAIDASANGDIVLIAPGTYYENVNFKGRAITVTSEQGPQVTIIDGRYLAPVVSFTSAEGSQSVLSGFTLQHGRALSPSNYDGGGVHIANASPTISGNLIVNNDANGSGGGISVSWGSPVIKGNTITNNGQTSGFSGGLGGGISITGAGAAQIVNNVISSNSESQGSGGGISLFAAGTPTIQNNVIRDNNAYSQGGGIYIVNASDALIVQNLIRDNNAPSGGGIYWLVPSGSVGPRLVSNTLAGNSATQGSALYAGGFQSQAQLINNVLAASAASSSSTLYCDATYSPTPPVLKSNDVFASSGTAYSGTCTGLAGTGGNVSVDPHFQNPGGGDYHLMSGSAAIDAGISDLAIPNTDLDNNPRVLDGNGDGSATIDLGCYEAPIFDSAPPVTTASPSPLPNSAGWNNSNITVVLNATDNQNGSGVKQIQYSLSGSALQVIPSSSAIVPITSEGVQNLNFGAVDKANNAESMKTVVLKLDKTGPLISGMPAPGCTLSPAKHQLITVGVVTASDPVSGVASLVVTATSNEPDSGTGGGDLPNDIVISNGTVQLRAERAPNGKGRVYTITAKAADLAGNTTVGTASCTVPK